VDLHFAAEVFDPLGRHVAQVPADKDIVLERRDEGLRAMADNPLPVGLFHVMRLDLRQDFGIESQSAGFVQCAERADVARVVIAAAQVVMDFGRLKTRLEIGQAGVFPQCLFVHGERFAPTPLGFELLGMVEANADFGQLIGRLCLGFHSPEAKQNPTEQRCECTTVPDPLSHSSFHLVRGARPTG
jgi:hypothetical protein